MTGDRWRLGHRPALDGLRGVAVLLVVVGHALLHGFKVPPGHTAEVGVAIFFTLSGFLITALLLQEHDRTGTVSLRRFYERRARRLLPAVLVLLVMVAALAPSFGHIRLLAAPGDYLGTLLYFQNWRMMNGADYSGLSHTWSLSIEEQFYLLWPLVLLGAARWGRRSIGAVAVVGILGSVALKLTLWHGGAGADRVYFGTDVRADNLLLGCLLAAVLAGRSDGRSRPLTGLVALAATVTIGLLVSPLWLPTTVAAGTCLTIALVAQNGPVGPLGWAPMVWLGKRSYALYLWHVPLYWMVGPFLSRQTAWIPAAVALGLAELSWRYVERPFMSRRTISNSRLKSASRISA